MLRDCLQTHSLTALLSYSVSPSKALIVAPLLTFAVNIRLTSLDHQSVTLLLDLHFVERPFKVSVWLTVVVSSFKALINKNVHTNGVSVKMTLDMDLQCLLRGQISVVLERL